MLTEPMLEVTSLTEKIRTVFVVIEKLQKKRNNMPRHMSADDKIRGKQFSTKFVYISVNICVNDMQKHQGQKYFMNVKEGQGR